MLVRVCAQCPRAAERRGELRSLATQLGVPDRERRVLARRVDCDGRGVWVAPRRCAPAEAGFRPVPTKIQAIA